MPNLLGRLRTIVGAEHVLTDPDLRAPYETDWTGRFHGHTHAVVRPRTTDEVAAVLKACAAHGIPVVPQGGNTGLVGGSVPRGGELVLSLRRLDEIAPVDADRGEVVVGAGATLATVREAAVAAGWDVGVDLAARDSATIGGMVATNAGGTQLVRYGAMGHQVIGLEAVRANGTVIGRVPALRKDNVGYHWNGVLAGSEGTLAVVTRVHLALVPLMTDRAVALVGVDDVETALRLAGHLRRSLDSVLSIEVCFAEGVDLVCAHTGLPWPLDERTPVLLLVECGITGSNTGSGARTTAVDGLIEILGTVEAVRASAIATDEAGRARLWSYRDRHTETVNALGIPHKLDVSLPFDALATFCAEVVKRIHAVAPEARVVLYGHLADGNLHVNVVGPDPDDDAVDEAILRLVIEMDGSISAEHGIGIAKRPYLALARPADDLTAMRDLKHALDPAWLLNPGVIFSP